MSSRDKDIDGLLEKLGETEDRPAAKEKPPGGGPGGPPPSDPQDGPKGTPDANAKKPADVLSGKSRELDEHLEELTGKRRKSSKQKADEQGPLSEVIKEMREVEERLGEPDTGEETRKKQARIVKQIETLIEQMQSSSGRSRSRKALSMRPEKQPGGKEEGQGASSGNGGPPATRPARPEKRPSMASGKDEWGHLPPELRQEMDNISQEEPLPARQELIRRYYLSVSKKSLSRGD